MAPDATTAAGSGVRYSCWRLSELREWFDLGFFDVNDTQDVEALCSFIGAYETLTWFRGVLPLVHGPVGCVASYSATRVQTRLPGQPRPTPYCTGLTTRDAIAGGADKLRQAIVELDAAERPVLIVVLSTCVSDIIGDDVDAVIREVGAQVSADLRHLPMAGTTGKGFRAGADQAIADLVHYVAERHAGAARSPRPTINLFTRRVSGKPSEDADIREVSRLLGKVGVGVNQVIRMGSTLDDLIETPKAWANGAFCLTWGDAPMDAMERCFGQPYTTVSYPVGVRQTVKWVDSIAALTGVPGRLAGDLEVGECERKLAALREELGGRVAYIWHPGEKALALARFAEELGMRPHIIGMPYWTQKITEPTITRMIADGQDYPMIIKGWQDLWRSHAGLPHAERPLLFMPRKFWTGELPTVSHNIFYDSLLGLSGVDRLLEGIREALDTAGRKDYGLFTRYVEHRYRRNEWNGESR